MTEEIIIDVSGCTHKRDDECMEVPICNEYGDLMGYQSCEAQTLCPYRSQEKIKQLKEQRDKYYQQTLDDEITISDLIEEIQELKADRTLERISKLSIENARLEQENENLKKEVKQIGSDFIKKGDYARELEQKNRELKAYKDVNEDFKKAWDELNKKYTEVLKLAKLNADSNEYCLKKLEKENKKLKEELKSYKHPDVVTLLTNWRTGELDRIHNKIANERDIYRSALEEIREIVNEPCIEDEDCETCDSNCMCKEILNKINEVLNNESN